jgi:DNA-binding transcriptional LysR family regulator
MDRLDAMTAFVVTADSGGLSAAARKLGRSPASVTRAVAFLEESLGIRLLQRTTRSVKITEAGDRYLLVCRRILSELAEAELAARGALDVPRGTLAVTAPVTFGGMYVRPLVDAYLEKHADVSVRLSLLDRVVNLVDEGFDAAIRIAHLPDSALIATKLGEVRRLVCASPKYLSRRGRPSAPSDLARHRCIAFSAVTPTDTWTFGSGRGGGRSIHVKVRPSLVVNTADAAIGSALDGNGFTCVLSYQVASALRFRPSRPASRSSRERAVTRSPRLSCGQHRSGKAASFRRPRRHPAPQRARVHDRMSVGGCC